MLDVSISLGVNDGRVLYDASRRPSSCGNRGHPGVIGIDNRFAVRTPGSPPELTMDLRDRHGRPSLGRDSHQVAASASVAAMYGEVSDGLIVGRPERFVRARGPRNRMSLFLVKVSNPELPV